MSRISSRPVEIPEGVEVRQTAGQIVCKGPLGETTEQLNPLVIVKIDGKELQVKKSDETKEANALAGTFRSLIANMVKGVSSGFEKRLTLVGVGFRAQVQGEQLNLSLGLSHPVVHKMPEGVKAETPTQTEIIIKGISKQRVGQVAAEVRGYRPPEPYKGKGVRYADERVSLKEAKKK